MFNFIHRPYNMYSFVYCLLCILLSEKKDFDMFSKSVCICVCVCLGWGWWTTGGGVWGSQVKSKLGSLYSVFPF